MNDHHAMYNSDQSSLGMAENLTGLLSYTAGFVTGILFFVLEKKSRFVKFHALQSSLFSGASLIFFWAVVLIPVLGGPLFMLSTPLGLIVWIVLMLKAYRHEYFELPVIGRVAWTKTQQWGPR